MKRLVLPAVLVFSGACWLLGRGDIPLSAPQVLAALLGDEGAAGFVVRELRLPPVVGAALGGAAMGMAGLLFQRCLHNTLATPDVIGVTSLASLFVLAAPMFGILHPLALSAVAVLGAVVALGSVLMLAGRAAGAALVLNGVAIGYFASGGIGYVLFTSDERSSQRAYGWLVGSTGFAAVDDLMWSVPLVSFALVAALLLVRPLRALELGDASARALGYPAARWRLVVLAVGVLLSGLATALVGPLAFVGITAPVLARRWVGAERHVEAGAMLMGALIVLAADIVISLGGLGRLPTGVLTGLVGAAVLVALVWRGRTSTSGVRA